MMVWSISGSATRVEEEVVPLGAASDQSMDTAKAVLILSLVWILVGSSIGVLEPPEWVQNVLVFAVIAAMR